MTIGFNILSVKSSLAFAPYLADAFSEFIDKGTVHSLVPRQGGKGLILRPDGNALVVRHEHRQETLTNTEIDHYTPINQLKSEIYDVKRMQDEVVLASIGCELLLSHPQSEMWLSYEAIEALVKNYRFQSSAEISGVPDWLKVSTAAGRMLLSDQRTGRWVLLGDDHLDELSLRLHHMRPDEIPASRSSPPVIELKGVHIHMQSALRLISTIIAFAAGADVSPFEEITSVYSLSVSKSNAGLELSDSVNRASLNLREARKWVEILQMELKRLDVRQFDRGRIRTTSVIDGGRKWLLQWGDEVFLPHDIDLHQDLTPSYAVRNDGFVIRRIANLLLLMNYWSGDCVALTDSEVALV